MTDLFRHPSSRIRCHPKLLVLVGVLCLALALMPGCGFIEDFFGGSPPTEDKALNKVKGKLTPQNGQEKAPGPSAAAGAPGSQDAAAPAKPSPEEEKLKAIEKIKAEQDARAAKFKFQPETMPDPFRPIDMVLAASKASKEEKQPEEKLTPLQKMELSQLKLVAVIDAGSDSRALVEDSTGTGYIISVGTEMGRKDGKVTAIYPDHIEIEEQVKNYMGEEKPRVSILKLHAIEGEQK